MLGVPYLLDPSSLAVDESERERSLSGEGVGVATAGTGTRGVRESNWKGGRSRSQSEY